MAFPGGLPAWGLVHLAIGAVGTWLARRYALHRELIDQPGERRSHRVATPRGGGIAMVAAAALGVAFVTSMGVVRVETGGLVGA